MIPLRLSAAARFLSICGIAMIVSGALTAASAGDRYPTGGSSVDRHRGDGGGNGGGGRRRGGGGGGNVGGLILRFAPQILKGLNNYDERRQKRVRTYDDDEEEYEPRRRHPRRKKKPARREPRPRVVAIPPLPVIPPERFTPPRPPSAPPTPFRRASALAERPQFRPGEVVVLIRGAEPDAAATQIAQSFNLVLEETISLALLQTSRIYRFSIPDNRAVPTVVAALATVPEATPAANSLYFLEGEAGSAALDLQYALPKMRVPAAQAIASGRGMSVAVIDSGVDASHPALKNADLTLVDVVQHGIDGPDMHGTAITGIIAASGDLVGIAPAAHIIAVRAFAPERLGDPPVTSTDALARGIDEAFSRGARIFNMSFAGERNAVLSEMIDAAYERGAVFVAAAGNEGPDAPPAYPAANEKVIAITATDETDAIYGRANRGGYVLAAAPGVDILAPVMGQGFDYLSGTSFAAAHVTGVIALLMERDPNLTAETVRSALVDAAHDLGAKGQDAEFGAGLTDAYGALLLVGEYDSQASR
jgi:hypothetical protein